MLVEEISLLRGQGYVLWLGTFALLTLAAVDELALFGVLLDIFLLLFVYSFELGLELSYASLVRFLVGGFKICYLLLNFW